MVTFDQAELLRISTLWESAITKTDELGQDLIATFRLIRRCFDLIDKAAKANQGSKQQIVAVGALQDLKMVFEETSSELLQLSGICQDAELYPNENAGESIVRRSQILDSALYRNGVQPIFMTLHKDEQLRIGNRFMDHLSILSQPENPELGLRQVVGMIESGHSLVELGIQAELDSVIEAEIDKNQPHVYDLTLKAKQLPNTEGPTA